MPTKLYDWIDDALKITGSVVGIAGQLLPLFLINNKNKLNKNQDEKTLDYNSFQLHSLNNQIICTNSYGDSIVNLSNTYTDQNNNPIGIYKTVVDQPVDVTDIFLGQPNGQVIIEATPLTSKESLMETITCFAQNLQTVINVGMGLATLTLIANHTYQLINNSGTPISFDIIFKSNNFNFEYHYTRTLQANETETINNAGLDNTNSAVDVTLTANYFTDINKFNLYCDNLVQKINDYKKKTNNKFHNKN